MISIYLVLYLSWKGSGVRLIQNDLTLSTLWHFVPFSTEKQWTNNLFDTRPAKVQMSVNKSDRTGYDIDADVWRLPIILNLF